MKRERPGLMISLIVVVQGLIYGMVMVNTVLAMRLLLLNLMMSYLAVYLARSMRGVSLSLRT